MMPFIQIRISRLARLIAAISVYALAGSAHGALPPKVTALTSVYQGLSTPLRIAADASGNFLVSDPRGGGILRYDNSWNLLQSIALPQKPLGMAISADGNLLVTQGDHVSIINSSGSETGMLGQGYGQFKTASGITLDDKGTIYVTDSLDNCVYIFSSSGAYISRFGEKGRDQGQMLSPSGIAYEKESQQLVVADTLNGRIDFFDLSGTFHKTIGAFGSGPLKFTAPQSIAFEYDSANHLARMYVADSFQSNVQIINPTDSGTFLGYVGSYGTVQGKLINPSDVLFDRSTSKLMVVNSLAGTISVYGINNSTISGAVHLSIDNPPTIANSPSVVLSGTASAGAIVTATTDSQAVAGPASYSSPTSWSLTVSNLQPGVNEVTVTATNEFGEYTSQIVAIALVNNSPTVTINSTVRLTNVPHLILSGTRQSSDTITVTSNTNAVAGAVNYLTSTSWEVTISDLSAGDNILTAVATNGSLVSAASVTVTLDSIPPTVLLAALPNSTEVAGPVQNIIGTASDDHLDRVVINGTAATLVGNMFSGAVVLGGGANDITVTAYDKAGNSSTTIHKLYFDAVKPALAVSSPSDVSYVKAGSITVQGTVEAGYTVAVNGSPAAISGTNWSASVGLNPGMNTLAIIASDGQGHSNTIKRTIINSSGPEIAITAPAQDLATKDGAISFSGTTEAGSTVAYSANGSTTVVPVINGTFNFSVSFSKQGVYPITVTTTNASGATNTIVRTVVFDDKPPMMTVNLTKLTTARYISGTTESGAIISAEVNGTIIGKMVAINGAWAFDLTGIDYTKDNLLIRATDAAGNVRTRSLYPTGAIVSGEGEPNITDALKLMRIALGYDKSSNQDNDLGDVAPLENGKPKPNGIIDANDVALVLYRMLGLITW